MGGLQVGYWLGSMAHSVGTTEFWKGDFGNDYPRRIAGEDLILQREAFFKHALGKIGQSINSVIEFGANRGLNLQALKRIAPFDITAVEVNDSALGELKKIEGVHVIQGNMLDFADATEKNDLSLSTGVLIHIHPDDLSKA
ncbi:MAG: hypothetical protein ACLPPF_07540 [Rhodomicrobium sp.]